MIMQYMRTKKIIQCETCYRTVVAVVLLFRPPPPLALADEDVVECNGDRSLTLLLYCCCLAPKLDIDSKVGVIPGEGLVGDVCTLVVPPLAFGSARSTVCGGIPWAKTEMVRFEVIRVAKCADTEESVGWTSTEERGS
jgi:hypothetical protein